jgi:hypothetical protein
MRRFSILMSIFALLCSVVTERADDAPKKFNFDRYTGMLNRSPFAVATAVALPSATPNFAKDLYLANAAKSPDGDLLTIASTSDKNFKEYLTTKGPVDGYSIANIEWSDKVGATKATISKDGQFATLTFNQALLAQSPPSNVPPPPGVVPGTGAPPTVIVPKPPPAAGVPTPPPRVRGVIPRNPNVAASPAPRPNVPPPPDE